MASEDISKEHPVPAVLLCDNQETLHFEDTSFHEHYTVRQMALRKERVFTDVLLKCKHLAIPCHKLALSSASPYFYRQLSSGEVTDIMEFQDVSPEILEGVIDYIYTASVEITANNVKDLVKASSELELSSLKAACDTFITERIEPANAIGSFVLAKNHQLETTATKAMDCLLKQPDDVLRLALDVEFQCLDEDTFIEWISQDELEVSDETVAFQLVNRWIDVDASRMNEKCVSKVLAHVRLGECPAGFLMKTVAKSSLIQYPRCLQMLEEAKGHALMMLAGESADNLDIVIPKPRKNAYKPHLVLMGGGTTGDVPNMQCWCLGEGDDTWEKLTQIPEEYAEYSYHMCSCIVGDSIILTGGSKTTNSEECTESVWQYCTTTRQWKALPSMRKARSIHGAVTVQSRVLVMGGWDGKVLSSVEMLDESRSQWADKAPLPNTSCDCPAFNINDMVYVLSGDQQQGSKSKTWLYDITADVWQEKAAMPSKNPGCSMISDKDSIYAVGGEAQCYRYDTSLDSWSQLSEPTSVHLYGSAVVMGGKILLCGGWPYWDFDKPTAKIEEFDINEGTWAEHELTLPKKIGGHCMLVAKLVRR